MPLTIFPLKTSKIDFLLFLCYNINIKNILNAIKRLEGVNMKYWIYWPEQCVYCINRKDCNYKEKVNNYISKIVNIEDKGIYGSLSWWCDYYLIDEEEYNKLSCNETRECYE